jgi:hypothetical protein
MIFRKRNRPFQKVDKNSTVLVLSGNEKEIITLNDTAFSIWNVCDGKSKEEIVSHIVELYNLNKDEFFETVKADCDEMINYLLENGLIKSEE